MYTTEMEIRSYAYSELICSCWKVLHKHAHTLESSEQYERWSCSFASCRESHICPVLDDIKLFLALSPTSPPSIVCTRKKCQRWPDFNQQIVPEPNQFLCKTSDSWKLTSIFTMLLTNSFVFPRYKIWSNFLKYLFSTYCNLPWPVSSVPHNHATGLIRPATWRAWTLLGTIIVLPHSSLEIATVVIILLWRHLVMERHLNSWRLSLISGALTLWLYWH